MVRQISVQQLAERLRAGEPVYLLDVRQPEEHAVCSLPNSHLIPLGELMHRAGEVEPPDDALLVVYCHHGIRSLSGAAILEQRGFQSVASLRGGIDAWSLHIDPTTPRY
jgi:adenylyltransferase/sulfurtransferase